MVRHGADMMLEMAVLQLALEGRLVQLLISRCACREGCPLYECFTADSEATVARPLQVAGPGRPHAVCGYSSRLCSSPLLRRQCLWRPQQRSTIREVSLALSTSAAVCAAQDANSPSHAA